MKCLLDFLLTLLQRFAVFKSLVVHVQLFCVIAILCDVAINER